MATTFGTLFIDFLDPRTTINSDRYGKSLPKLRRATQNRSRGKLSKGIRLHHDNARWHIDWILVHHQPYGFDFATSDY